MKENNKAGKYLSYAGAFRMTLQFLRPCNILLLLRRFLYPVTIFPSGKIFKGITVTGFGALRTEPLDSKTGIRFKGIDLSLFPLFLILFVSLAILRPAPALCHKVNVFAFAEGGHIVTESYFNSGDPCKDSAIQVFDTAGNELLSGRTDTKGLFSFKIPGKIALKIVLTASLGHKAEYLLHASEIPGSFSEPTDPIAQSPDPLNTPSEASDHKTEQQEGIQKIADNNKEESVKSPAGDESAKRPLSMADLDQIKEVVTESVEEAMRPLIMRLAKEESTKTSLTDVIGGIGYIFGIMGIIFYFKKREK